MSTAITFTFGTADPGCCVRTCQDILDLVESKLSGSIPDNLHGIIISHEEPGPDDRDKLWIKTTNDKNCEFVGMLIWCEESGAWVDFTFDPSTITPGNDCTFLGTKDGEVQHRTLSQLIDCLEEKHIPCSKIDFGTVVDGCQFQTWSIQIEANLAAFNAGRIEFDVSWTSATCGNGRKFVTYSPVANGVTYTVEVCMPSDAANITVTNILGVEVGAWINSAVNCTPDTCTNTGIATVTEHTGPLPSAAGTAGAKTWVHGFSSHPDVVSVWAKCTEAHGGHQVDDMVDLGDISHNTNEEDTPAYVFFVTATTVVVYACDEFADAVLPNYDATANNLDPFDDTKWKLYIKAVKFS
jgi:hypothetical protein